MSISIACPGCQTKFKVADTAEGKRVKCKKCGGPIAVPVLGEVEIRVVEDPDETPSPAPPPVRSASASTPPSTPPSPPLRQPAVAAVPTWNDANAEPAPSGGVASFPPPPAYRVPGPRPRRLPAAGYVPAAATSGIRRSTAAPEGFSPMLLFAFVVAVLVGITAVSLNPPAHATSAYPKVIWALGLTMLVMFFVAMVPITMGGVWIASKAMKFELAAPAYLKAGAIAALPMVMVMSLYVLPKSPVLIGGMILAILPVCFIMTKLLFALLPVEAIVAFLLAAVGWVAGIFVVVFLSLALVGTMDLKDHSSKTADNNQPQDVTDNSGPRPDSGWSQPPSHSSSYQPVFREPSDPLKNQLTSLRDRAGMMQTSNWLRDASKESMTSQVTDMRSQLNDLSPGAKTEDQKTLVDQIGSALDQLQAKAASLPSSKPDETIYNPITDAGSFGSQPADDSTTVPASFRRYRLSVPRDAAIDLSSVEDSPQGLIWETGSRNSPGGKLTITSVPRKDPRQQRPWVKTRSFMTADSDDVFMIDAINIPVEVSYGTINGLPATRIAQSPPDTSESTSRFRSTQQRWVKYVIADGQVWVVITCSAPADDSRSLLTMEESARTVRQARGDEPRIEPFSAEAVVARITDEHAEAIIRRLGHAAEPALLARLDDSDPSVKEKVIQMLAIVGTKESVVPLMRVAKVDDFRLAPIAKDAIKKISPADMDDATDAVLTLQSKRNPDRNAALRKLAGFTPKADDPRKAGVSTLLCNMLQDNSAMWNADAGLLGDALAVWQTPGAIPSLLPLLKDDPSLSFNRKNVMMALAHTKDKRAVFPICQWLINDTEASKEALIDMGPAAEFELDKLLSYKEPKVRDTVVQILNQTGTAKSLKPLDNFIYDYKKNPLEVTIAEGAIEAIKDRIAHPSTNAGASTDDAGATSKPTDPNSALFDDPPKPTPRAHRTPRTPQ